MRILILELWLNPYLCELTLTFDLLNHPSSSPKLEMTPSRRSRGLTFRRMGHNASGYGYRLSGGIKILFTTSRSTYQCLKGVFTPENSDQTRFWLHSVHFSWLVLLSHCFSTWPPQLFLWFPICVIYCCGSVLHLCSVEINTVKHNSRGNEKHMQQKPDYIGEVCKHAPLWEVKRWSLVRFWSTHFSYNTLSLSLSEYKLFAQLTFHDVGSCFS